MLATKVQLTGGAFQDSEGNVLNLGYLKMRLNQDAEIVSVGQIAAGIVLTINLDASGNVVSSPAQSVWGNDQMSPVNAYYRVSGYTASGQLAWGPNNQQVIGSGGTFDVGTWTPNRVISWVPPVQVPELEVNGTPNTVQTELDFVNSATVTWTDNGDGSVSAATARVTELEVNGTPNTVQTELDFVNSATVTWTDNGNGSVSAATVASTPASGSNLIPGNIFAGVQSSQRNSTIFVCLPAAALLVPVSSFKLVLHVCGSGTGPMTVGGIKLYTTPRASNVISSSVNVTIGSTSTPTITVDSATSQNNPMVITTDTINVALDYTHDRYFGIYFTDVSANSNFGILNCPASQCLPVIFSAGNGNLLASTTIPWAGGSGSGHAGILVAAVLVP